MDFPLPKDLKTNPKVFLQRAGYHEFVDPNTGERSFIKRLGEEFYPRFHIYLDEDEKGTFISLHIDQKHNSYQGSRAHAGEYNGPVVEEEANRIKEAADDPSKLELTEIETGAVSHRPGHKPGGILTDHPVEDLRSKLGL